MSWPKTIDEREAEGEIARVYHELVESLRTTGVNLVFRRWAAHERFLVLLWEDMRANVESLAFEEAGDHVRAEAVRIAERLGAPGVDVPLGPAQRFGVTGALQLYHYVNPKLLVLVAAVHHLLDGGHLGSPNGAHVHDGEPIERGAPAGMHAMEMVAEDDPELKPLFERICRRLALESINSDYRTLGLWPQYLEALWQRLEPTVGRREYARGADELRATALSLCQSLPYPVRLGPERLGEAGVDVAAVRALTASFLQLLPGLCVNIALAGLDHFPSESWSSSPFPPLLRQEVA